MFQKVSHSRENHVSLIITYYQQTDICLPKGQCIEGSGLNSFPSHSLVFLSRLFHSHKSSHHPNKLVKLKKIECSSSSRWFVSQIVWFVSLLYREGTLHLFHNIFLLVVSLSSAYQKIKDDQG